MHRRARGDGDHEPRLKRGWGSARHTPIAPKLHKRPRRRRRRGALMRNISIEGCVCWGRGGYIHVDRRLRHQRWYHSRCLAKCPVEASIAHVSRAAVCHMPGSALAATARGSNFWPGGAKYGKVRARCVFSRGITKKQVLSASFLHSRWKAPKWSYQPCHPCRIRGCHPASRMGCKPEGFPEVAPVQAVSSGTCLSSLPCSHRPMRDIHEVI